MSLGAGRARLVVFASVPLMGAEAVGPADALERLADALRAVPLTRGRPVTCSDGWLSLVPQERRYRYAGDIPAGARHFDDALKAQEKAGRLRATILETGVAAAWAFAPDVSEEERQRIRDRVFGHTLPVTTPRESDLGRHGASRGPCENQNRAAGPSPGATPLETLAMMQWHPIVEKFPPLEGEEFEALKASIKSTQGNKDNPIFYRVVDGQIQGLDGRNRYRACKELRLKPTLKRVQVRDEDVLDFVIRQNINRRHLTPELRRQLVAELRADGKSEREIAGALGTSPATVHRDLAATHQSSPASNEAPGRITGRDGKTYSAAKPQAGDAREEPVLCSRCQRVGPVKDCEQCKKAEQAAANKKGTRLGPQKNGQMVYDWRPFNGHFGGLIRQVTALGKLYGAKDSVAAKELDDLLGVFLRKFKDWHRALTRRPVSEG